MWNSLEITQLCAIQLKELEAEINSQSTYRGLDSYSEVQLHPFIHQAFTTTHFGALREICYPSASVENPTNTQRQRCDIVLTPNLKQSIFDPIDEQRTRQKAAGTLFESSALLDSPPQGTIPPEDAYWLEIKSIAQFSYVDGVPNPNSSYSSEMLNGPRTDVIKLASDPLIRHAGVLIVHFAEDQSTGIHDISAAVDHMIGLELPVSIPEFETIPIKNHAGNEYCTLGLIPVRL
ncbi:MAG: hypothetical protein P1U42_04065 [Phycisphaerales bacterium]|nr:hypothetical protein [Phycisphaerales bacterium]